MTNIGLRSSMDSFVKGYAHFTRGLRKACELALIIMTVTTMYHLILRYFFNIPTYWAIEINGYLLVFISLIVMAEVVREKRMIEIDLFVRKLSSTAQLRLKLFFLLLIMLFCFATTWVGIEMAVRAYQRGLFREGILHTPLFIPYSIIPVSMGLMFLQALIEIRENAKKLVHLKNSKGVSS